MALVSIGRQLKMKDKIEKGFLSDRTMIREFYGDRTGDILEGLPLSLKFLSVPLVPITFIISVLIACIITLAFVVWEESFGNKTSAKGNGGCLRKLY